MIVGAILGLGFGAGAVAMMFGLSPRARVQPLDIAIRNAERSTSAPVVATSESAFSRFVDWLMVRRAGRALDGVDSDISVCGYTSASFVAAVFGRVLGMMVMALVGILLFNEFGGVQTRIPTGLTVLVSVTLGVVGAWSVWREVKAKAVSRRAEFVESLSVLVDFVRLGVTFRPINGAVGAGLDAGKGWAFDAMRAGVEDSARYGETLSEGLNTVGMQLGVPELVDFANIVERAGDRGSSLTDALEAKSESMRQRLMASELAEADSATAKLEAPLAVMTVLLMVFVMFPAASAFGT